MLTQTKTENTYLEQLYQHQKFAELQKHFSVIFDEPLCANFIEIIIKKVNQGLTMDNIVKFHEKYPKRSIFRLFGFISDKCNNVHILLPT